MNAVMLDHAEAVLLRYAPSDFDADMFAAPECIEVVRVVEDSNAWQGRYRSVEEFYASHEARHPDIRLYGRVRRAIATDDPLASPGGTIQVRLARLRADESA